MEHLDSLAGSIAYKHMLGADVETLGKIHERGFYIVTASVDRCARSHPQIQRIYNPIPKIRHALHSRSLSKPSFERAGHIHGQKLNGGCRQDGEHPR